jgi:hypothetical protein
LQLETALAAESRKFNSSSESEDYTRARIPSRSRKQSRKVRPSNGSISNSSEQGSIRKRADSLSAKVAELDARTRSASIGSEVQKLRGLRQAESDMSLDVRPDSPPVPSPITPALTPGMGTTDDEDLSDFQSACSVSPRDSYSESYNDHTTKVQNASDCSEASTPTAADSPFSSRQRNFITVPRNRAVSNATTVGARHGTDTSGDMVGDSQNVRV